MGHQMVYNPIGKQPMNQISDGDFGINDKSFITTGNPSEDKSNEKILSFRALDQAARVSLAIEEYKLNKDLK